MGQKVNPIGFRLAVSKDWRSKWYAPKKEFADSLHADLEIRNYLKEKLMQAALSKIVIERAWNQVRVTLHTARPGLVIGRKGQEIEVMSQKISEMCGGRQVKIDIFDVSGKLVRRLTQEVMSQGRHGIRWDGSDDRGRQSASGVYFCRLDAGGAIVVRKMMTIK